MRIFHGRWVSDKDRRADQEKIGQLELQFFALEVKIAEMVNDLDEAAIEAERKRIEFDEAIALMKTQNEELTMQRDAALIKVAQLVLTLAPFLEGV